MKINNDKCVCSGCSVTGAILGVIFGVIVGILFALGYIPFISNAAWIALVLSATAFLGIIAISVFGACGGCCGLVRCLLSNISCLMTGTVGTLIFAISAVSVTLFTSAIASIILVAAATFFFTFLIVGLIYFINCLVKSS